MKKSKRGQEEIIGFALIIVFVAIIFLVFISLSLNKKSQTTVESYEAESFLQAVLDYTTSCEDYKGRIEIRDLVFDCNEEFVCLNGENSCDVLNETIGNILEKSWNIEEESLYKGYEFEIKTNEKSLICIQKGNQTKNSKGAVQDYSKNSRNAEISFNIYS